MSFHNKFRPRTLERLIGNQRAVTQLQGIIKSGKFPSGILFTGPPGVGKTTIARAFVNAVLPEENVAENLTEWNFGSERSIEDVRGLIQISRLRPAPGASRRFIIGDEVHQLVTNAPAANAFLKPLEEPTRTTTFLLCSMEPDKFSSTTGKALASRCLQVSLEKPSEADMTKQAKRIVKAEEMVYAQSEEILSAVVSQSEFSMRVLANNLELLKGYADGLEKTPKTLSMDALGEALSSAATNDDLLAVRYLTAVYSRKFVAAQREILDVQDGVGFIIKVLSLSSFCLNMVVLKGQRHPKVFSGTPGWTLFKSLNGLFGELGRDQQIALLSETMTALTQMKLSAGAFAVDEKTLLSATTWNLIQRLKITVKGG